MKQLFLGSNPVTSIVGYLIAAATVIQTALEQGETNWFKIVVAALIAVLGRVSSDSGKK